MNGPTDLFRSRTDGMVVPRIWLAVALSMLVHIAALWELPPISVRLPEPDELPGDRRPLSLRLAPPGPVLPPPIAVPPRPSPEAVRRAERPRPAPRPQPTPPVIAPTPAVPAPPVTPAPAGDMASYIEARRRARGESDTPAPAAAESAEARATRLVEGNLASTRQTAFGYDPSRGGGVFQMQSMSLDHAEFLFHGWNKDVGRNTKQLIEVRRGNNSDIRVAVVRRMIAIIREYEREDFLWQSRRLGRSITLSARARDNAGLEEFMMREFFFVDSPARR